MKYNVIFDDTALIEMQDAYNYYEEQQQGLGEPFKSELEKTIEYLQKNPKHFKRIKGEIRQALIHRFPYLVVYEIFDDTILVYAVFHTSRNPNKKFKN